jgi:hypothetical protein
LDAQPPAQAVVLVGIRWKSTPEPPHSDSESESEPESEVAGMISSFERAGRIGNE